MKDLSIIIPARNEIFLARTIQDILENIEADTEIIAILDGEWANPPVPDNDRVTLIYHSQSVGQRAATNEGLRVAKGKYVMKVDAHCAFDKGFDRKMLDAFKEVGDNVTMVPIMKNLHAFDWVCPDAEPRKNFNGGDEPHRRYQSPSGPCKQCGKPTTRDIVWYPKRSPNSTSYRFDNTLHFQYFGDYAKRPEAQTPLSESMSLQGSCFMLTKEKYIELNICDETWGSWGNQGTEVACKTWLSGGRVICNKNTWYAHMFRTQGGDFGFPYPQSGKAVERAREQSRGAFLDGTWDKAIHPLSWLIEKFAPVPDWEVIPEKAKVLHKGPSKGIIYYTDNQLDSKIAIPVQNKLREISKEKHIPIISASLKRMDFGEHNICFPSLRKGYLSMFKQIVGALENSTADIIYFCEHDVLYHLSHFDFTPSDKDTFYYNQNVWFLRMPDGHGLHYDVNQLSGLCLYRETALIHFKERLQMAQAEYERLQNIYSNPEELTTMFNRFIRNMGFEPFTHNRVAWQNQFKQSTWKSEFPNIDIKHGQNATGQRWRKDQYRNQQLLINWTEGEEIPGWGKGIDLVNIFG